MLRALEAMTVEKASTEVAESIKEVTTEERDWKEEGGGRQRNIIGTIIAGSLRRET